MFDQIIIHHDIKISFIYLIGKVDTQIIGNTAIKITKLNFFLSYTDKLKNDYQLY